MQHTVNSSKHFYKLASMASLKTFKNTAIAESNWNKSVQQMYNSHEDEKKKEYGPRVLQVEKATMTAAVMSFFYFFNYFFKKGGEVLELCSRKIKTFASDNDCCRCRYPRRDAQVPPINVIYKINYIHS